MNERKYLEVNIKTEHPHPMDSPDYLVPGGAIEDNHSNQYFIYEIEKAFNGLPFRVLDLGCAGGQFVVDLYNKGLPWMAIGVEGGNIYGMTEEFDLKERETGVISCALGSENWKRYEGKCLFHADISKPFEIVENTTAALLEFDIITAYEFLEHPTSEEIPQILENVKKHLHSDGLFIGTINLSPGFHHRCSKPIEWWNKIFSEYGFDIYHYPFMTTPRTSPGYITSLVSRHRRYPDVEKDQLWIRDQTVIGPRSLEYDHAPFICPGFLHRHPPIPPELCQEENYPFCARLKREIK